MQVHVGLWIGLWGMAFGHLLAQSFCLMHYNLLHYGPDTAKDAWLQQIVDYVQPTLFTANEVMNDSAYGERLVARVLQPLHPAWRRAPWTPDGAQMVSLLFYRSDQWVLRRTRVVETLVRNIPVYWLWYRPALPTDTLELVVAVAHLKASQNSANQQERKWMVQALTDSLEVWGVQAWMLAGDLNFYTSSEPAYQWLVTYPDSLMRLWDPFPAGNWHNNDSFALWHTQSTRRVGLPDGGATGGMDDRFDFILPSYALNYSIQWDTFYVFAQNGQYFDQAIIEASPLPLPDYNLVQALYYMSDHLPVVACGRWKGFVGSIDTTTSVASGPVSGRSCGLRFAGAWQWLVTCPVQEILMPDGREIAYQLQREGKGLYRLTLPSSVRGLIAIRWRSEHARPVWLWVH